MIRRTALLAVVVAFLAFLAALTIDDVAVYGVAPLDLVSVLIVAFFAVGVVRALLRRPPGE
jgi:hypothetical protein